MMTAEQFWQDWDDKKWAKPSPEIVKPVCVAFAEAYHRAESAAQLAEKEREIGRLTNTNCCGDAHMELEAAMHMLETLGFKKETQPDGHTHVWRNVRAEAAEQRLQEAQAEIKRQQEDLTHIGLRDLQDLRERLRQREAELEQRWIAVGERYPESSNPVLTWGPTFDCCAIFSFTNFFGRGRNGAKTWIDEHGNDSSSYGEKEFGVTHWQPLPSPPKVQP